MFICTLGIKRVDVWFHESSGIFQYSKDLIGFELGLSINKL